MIIREQPNRDPVTASGILAVNGGIVFGFSVNVIKIADWSPKSITLAQMKLSIINVIYTTNLSGY